MGVIYVVAEAAKLGYHGDHPDWCNLGQGMPEVGLLPGAPPPFSRVTIRWRDHAYGPAAGIPELREAVAALYNRWFHRGKRSQYTAANVAICAGRRLSLTRAIWALRKVRLGYFTPDSTAYGDLIGGVPRTVSCYLPLSPSEGFAIDGGGPRWLQRAAVELVGARRADGETRATRAAFRPKRDLMVERLKRIGDEFPQEPEGTFYCWGPVAGRPGELSDGRRFFREALWRRVLTVPGEFFDMNPGKRRKGRSRLSSYVRFSSGPPMAVRCGLDRLERMIASTGRR